MLVVDDEKLFGESIRDHLDEDGVEVLLAHTLADARALLAEQSVDLMLLDNDLPDGQGLAFLGEQRALGFDGSVLVVTGSPSLDNAVEAMRMGILDYLDKPVALEELRLAVLRSLEELWTVRREQAQSRSRRAGPERPRSAAATEAWAAAERAARSDTTVLLTGETGTGKTVLARAIHDWWNASRPFVSVNCGALPENLIEAELFGTEAGAFTGAKARKGLFEAADGGTLLLDEVGELPLHLQTKLLTVLDEGVIRPIGGHRSRRVSARVIAATNVDLEAAVAAGDFREDLLYRLDVFRIEMPPLRERRGDMPELIERLLRQLEAPPTAALAEGELEALMAHSWPGNLRELRNVLDRALLLDPVSTLRPSQHLRASRGQRSDGPAPSLESLAEVERAHTLRTLEVMDGHRQETARVLGIGVSTLRRKLKEWGYRDPR